MNVDFSTGFSRRFRKLPQDIQIIAKVKLKIFIVDHWEPSLKTHKLHGKREEQWAFSINYEYRVVFRQQDEEILLVDIGLHDDVY